MILQNEGYVDRINNEHSVLCIMQLFVISRSVPAFRDSHLNCRNPSLLVNQLSQQLEPGLMTYSVFMK
jgi:hypothetical protein